MKRKEYTEEKEGAKERFDRAMKTIFRAQKPKATEKEQKDAPSQRDDESANDGE